MTVVHNTKPSAGRHGGRFYRLDADGATFTAQLDAGTTVITVTGELDAANIHHFREYADRHVTGGGPIVLDLSQLDFLAAQGIQTLLEFDGECIRSGVDWALVSGRSAARLLRICDSDGSLPSVTSISEALERFSRPAPMSLQLVTKSS
jgi:anti-anti-sigma factor